MAKNTSKKEQILETARRLFSKAGFSNVSMDTLAKEANVSKPTLYSHFKSKDEILSVIIVEFFKKQIVTNFVLSNIPNEFKSSLEEYGMKKIELLLSSENLNLSRIFYAEIMQSPKLTESLLSSIKELNEQGLPALLQAGHKMGAIELKNIPEACDIYYGIIKGMVFWPVMLNTMTEDQARTKAKRAVTLATDLLFDL